MSKPRGGIRSGAGRPKAVEGASVRVRISRAAYDLWTDLKVLKKLKNDNAVAEYLLDMAAVLEEQVPPM